MTAFLEYQFPPGISYGSSGGPMFNTTVNINKAGQETRQVNWPTGRHKYNVTYGIRNQDDFEAILKLFHACQGRAVGFRFKDWSDYKSCAPSAAVSALDVAWGTPSAPVSSAPLIKNYIVGGATNVRTIKKPVAGTVKIAFNGVEQTTGWTVDTTTGVVAFSPPAGAGVVVTCGYEFDVPVRFDVDELSIILAKPQLCQTDIHLIEDMNA